MASSKHPNRSDFEIKTMLVQIAQKVNTLDTKVEVLTSVLRQMSTKLGIEFTTI